MTEEAGKVTAESLAQAVSRAYQLGQTYWQQADSESYKQNRLAGETAAKFEQLLCETKTAIADQLDALDAERVNHESWVVAHQADTDAAWRKNRETELHANKLRDEISVLTRERDQARETAMSMVKHPGPEIEALRKKVAALEQDAARYRWLRTNCRVTSEGPVGVPDHPALVFRYAIGKSVQWDYHAEGLDAAIDFRLAAPPTGEKP